MIRVDDPDPSWPETFRRLRDLYTSALAGVPVVAIEHVGSTAVAGLAAKPVIDIDIVVAAEDVAAASAALAGIGFEPLGDLGVPHRWAFRTPAALPRTHTYVVVEGSLALRNHLGVRDVLRSDPGLRAEYGGLKRRLAAQLDDIDAYTAAKSELVQRILERAGLSAEDRAVIAALTT